MHCGKYTVPSLDITHERICYQDKAGDWLIDKSHTYLLSSLMSTTGRTGGKGRRSIGWKRKTCLAVSHEGMQASRMQGIRHWTCLWHGSHIGQCSCKANENYCSSQFPVDIPSIPTPILFIFTITFSSLLQTWNFYILKDIKPNFQKMTYI